jgi:hypothetical protein
MLDIFVNFILIFAITLILHVFLKNELIKTTMKVTKKSTADQYDELLKFVFENNNTDIFGNKNVASSTIHQASRPSLPATHSATHQNGSVPMDTTMGTDRITTSAPNKNDNLLESFSGNNPLNEPGNISAFDMSMDSFVSFN